MTYTVDIQPRVGEVCARTVTKHTHTYAHVSFIGQASCLLSLDGQNAAIQRLYKYYHTQLARAKVCLLAISHAQTTRLKWKGTAAKFCSGG